MTERSTTWSITINNPTEAEVKCVVPGWKLSGQYEKGKEGTVHFQGMLKTPQVRFSQIKRAFPRAHIEAARNATALAAYVSKEDTRVASFETTSVPSLFQYQDTVASLWDELEFNRRRNDDLYLKRFKYDAGDIALNYVDEIVAGQIESGTRGIEFIAINPMWRSSWKKFYASIIKRNARPPQSETFSEETPQAGRPQEESGYAGTACSDSGDSGIRGYPSECSSGSELFTVPVCESVNASSEL